MASRGVTQSDIADALGLTQTQVSRRLSGVIDWRLNELAIVTQVLDVTLADLIRPVAA